MPPREVVFYIVKQFATNGGMKIRRLPSIALLFVPVAVACGSSSSSSTERDTTAEDASLPPTSSGDGGKDVSVVEGAVVDATKPAALLVGCTLSPALPIPVSTQTLGEALTVSRDGSRLYIALGDAANFPNVKEVRAYRRDPSGTCSFSLDANFGASGILDATPEASPYAEIVETQAGKVFIHTYGRVRDLDKALGCELYGAGPRRLAPGAIGTDGLRLTSQNTIVLHTFAQDGTCSHAAAGSLEVPVGFTTTDLIPLSDGRTLLSGKIAGAPTDVVLAVRAGASGPFTIALTIAGSVAPSKSRYNDRFRPCGTGFCTWSGWTETGGALTAANASFSVTRGVDIPADRWVVDASGDANGDIYALIKTLTEPGTLQVMVLR
jgi:hypothetical protein